MTGFNLTIVVIFSQLLLFLILESADNDGVVQLNSSQIELIKKSEDAVNDGDFFTDKEIEGDLDEGLKE